MQDVRILEDRGFLYVLRGADLFALEPRLFKLEPLLEAANVIVGARVTAAGTLARLREWQLEEKEVERVRDRADMIERTRAHVFASLPNAPQR